MAVTVDNTIARVSNDGGTSVTSGSFNTTTGDGLVACFNTDTDNNSVLPGVAISDNQAPDLTWVAINDRGPVDAGHGWAGNWYAAAPGIISGLTVTGTCNGGADSPSVKIYKLTGHDAADMAGAINEGNLTTDPQTTTAITSETAGAFFANWTDWNETGTPTSSDLTVAGFNTAGDISGASGYKSIGAPSSSVTGNMNSGGTPDGNWTAFEIRAGAGAAAASLLARPNPMALHLVR